MKLLLKKKKVDVNATYEDGIKSGFFFLVARQDVELHSKRLR